MARRKHKAKRNRRTARAVSPIPSRSHTRRGVAQGGRPRKVPDRRPAAGQRPTKRLAQQWKRRQQSPRVRKHQPKFRLRRSDPRIEVAVLAMNRGGSLTTAARSVRLPSKDLQQLLSRQGLLVRKGNRWVPDDDRLRQVLVITAGRIRPVIVRGYKEASVAGEHFAAAGKFVSTNDPKILEPYKDRTIQATDGRRYVLETDPNALHRIAAMDSPVFHEIYEITSST